jgi:aspartate racemase
MAVDVRAVLGGQSGGAGVVGRTAPARLPTIRCRLAWPLSGARLPLPTRRVRRGRRRPAGMGERIGSSTTSHGATPAVAASGDLFSLHARETRGSSMRRLGLIGGMSWESTAVYYRLINQEVRARLGPLRSAELLLYSVDFGPLEQCMRDDRWDEVAATLAAAAQRLRAGGAECIVLCTNTMHKVADRIESAAGLPLLHIADAAGQAAAAAGVRCVGLLATAYTMEQPFLKDRLAQRFGLEVLVPEAAERRQVHRIIFEELCAGLIREDSRRTYRQVIDSLARRGAQAIVLGCTEIALLIGDGDSALPLLDTTALHARAAVDFALQPTGAAGTG